MARKRATTPRLASSKRVPVARQVHAKVNDTFYQNVTQNQYVKQAGTQELVGAITGFGNSLAKMEDDSVKQIDSQQLAYANLIKSKAETDVKVLMTENPGMTQAELLKQDAYKNAIGSLSNIQGKLQGAFTNDFQAGVYDAFSRRDAAINHTNMLNLASDTFASSVVKWGENGIAAATQNERMTASRKLFKGWGASDEEVTAIFLGENEAQVTAGGHSTIIADNVLESGFVSSQGRRQIAKLKVDAAKKSLLEKNIDKYALYNEATDLLKGRSITREWTASQVKSGRMTAAEALTWQNKQETAIEADLVDLAVQEQKSNDLAIIRGAGGSTQDLSTKGRKNAYEYLKEYIYSDVNHPLNKDRDEKTPIPQKDLDAVIFKQLADAGIQHSGTKTAMEDGSRTLLSLEDGAKANPAFKVAYDRFLIAQNTGYLHTLDLGVEQLATFEAVDSFLKVGGAKSFDAAVVQANHALTNPNGAANLKHKFTIKQGDLLREIKATDMLEASWGVTQSVFGVASTKEASFSNMLSELNHYQDLLIRAGANPDDAQKQALERAKNYENIGGVMYHNRGMALAQHRGHILARSNIVVEEYLKKNPSFSHVAEDFVMKPSANQTFTLIDKDTRLPATDRNNRIVRLSLHDFLESGGSTDKIVMERTRNEIKENQKQ